MDLTTLGDHLTFHLTPLAGQSFDLSSELIHYTQDQLYFAFGAIMLTRKTVNMVNIRPTKHQDVNGVKVCVTVQVVMFSEHVSMLALEFSLRHRMAVDSLSYLFYYT